MSETTPQSGFSAEALRKHMSELEFERIREVEQRRKAAEDAMEEFVQRFTGEHLTEDEIEQMRIKVRHAAERGLTEVMVMKFPSSLCSDQGRAINNREPDWPDTLTGKARDFYDEWDDKGRKLGFKLKSMIVDFPDGKPGDVGIFVSWGA